MEQALNNFRQALRQAAAKLGLPAFWRWWTGELASLAPMGPRAALQRRRRRPMLAFGDGVAVLWEPRVVDGVLVLAEVARVPTGGDLAATAQAGRAMIEALPRRPSGGAPVKVVIALPPSQVLRKQLMLPAAVEENLKDALAYDLDRHTPFRADQLYFDAVVIERDPAKKLIRVDWAAVLKTVVDTARRHVESWGALVVGVSPEAPTGEGGSAAPSSRWSKLNLLPEEERPEIVVWRRPRFWLPATVIAVAAVTAVALPIWQRRDYVITLGGIVEQAHAEAAASDALRQQLDQATGDYNFALGKKYAYPSTVQLLDDVTKILPDDTWLTQFEIKSTPKGKEPHREMLLRGESANAGKLISALEDSKLFEQAAPRSPTTKIQPGPGEVFDLGAQLKPLSPPETVVLSAAAPSVPAAATAPAAAAAAAPGGGTVPAAASTAAASAAAAAAAAAGASEAAAAPAAAAPPRARPADALPAANEPAEPAPPGAPGPAAGNAAPPPAPEPAAVQLRPRPPRAGSRNPGEN